MLVWHVTRIVPLYPNELTPAPPTVTPLPTPLANQVRFVDGDIGWVPASVSEAAFRLDMTRFPEPLKPDLSNKSPQSCSQNTMIEVLYSGVRETGEIYHLIDCNGAVGWTRENRLLGPIELVINDRALTTEAGVDANNFYKVIISDPPYEENAPFQQTADCRVNDTVDVVAMSGFSTGELYYKIRCTNPFNPALPSLGWVVPDALFGPVRFRNGGKRGIVPQEFDSIDLLNEPNGDEVMGTCEQGAQVQITDTPVQRIDDQFFYEVACGESIGWSSQDFLVGSLLITMLVIVC